MGDTRPYLLFVTYLRYLDYHLVYNIATNILLFGYITALVLKVWLRAWRNQRTHVCPWACKYHFTCYVIYNYIIYHSLLKLSIYSVTFNKDLTIDLLMRIGQFSSLNGVLRVLQFRYNFVYCLWKYLRNLCF